MATQCHSTLNPSATAFRPNHTWTVMNRPRFQTLCRYHCADSGNHCRFGAACWYIHAQELHRPTYAEQQTNLLQAVLSILTFAVSCLQQPQFPSPTTSGFAAQQTKAAHDDADADDTADPDSAISHLQSNDASGAYVNGDVTRSTKNIMVPTTTIDSAEDEDDDDDADHGPRHSDVNGLSECVILPFEDVLLVDVDLDIPDKANINDDAAISFRNTLSEDKSDADEDAADDDVKSVDYDRAQTAPSTTLSTTLPSTTPTTTLTTSTTPSTIPSTTARKATKKAAKAKKASNSSNEMALWVNLLSNAPEALIQKYPEMLDLFHQQHFLGASDGVLHGLKATNLNDKEIIFKGRSSERERFVVQLFDLSQTPRTLLVKDENIRCLKPEPVRCAFSKFKDSLREHEWNELTLGNLCFHNEALVSLFICDQLPYYLEMTAKTQKPYDDICEDSMRELSEHGVGVTESDCQIIISFLYALAFSRKIHILRRFEIPP